MSHDGRSGARVEGTPLLIALQVVDRITAIPMGSARVRSLVSD
jgi:hypothetical protein